MLMPFRMIYELIVFALQFAFVYGLALMGLFAFFAWLIAGYTPDIPVFIEPIRELICERLEGCALFPEATTSEEYCPDCIRR